MNWIDHDTYIEMFPPKEFSFEECLIFLGRSGHEVLHQIIEGSVYKLLQVKEGLVLCKIGFENDAIRVEFPMGPPSIDARYEVAVYVWEWFDLDQDLAAFYRLSSEDTVLKNLTQKYYGLRMMAIPDLFEAIVWAIIGQQINLTFAYKLKKRFVEQFGTSLTFEGKTFWVFPSSEQIALLNVDDLRTLQFSVRKAEYIINIAQLMSNHELSKELLLQKEERKEILKSLTSIRGVGAWTADYVMMKCFHMPSAFPVADVGLHQALKNVLELEKKPTLKEIEEYAENWKGWQGYATFYLWRSLYDKDI